MSNDRLNKDSAEPGTTDPAGNVTPAVKVRPAHVWKVATTPRMLGFAVLILAAVVITVKLGTWQLDRAVARAEQTQAAELNARLESDPEPLADIVPPQTQFVQSMVGQRVEVSGTFEGPEFFVLNQFDPDPSDPKNKALWTHGYWILSRCALLRARSCPWCEGGLQLTTPLTSKARATKLP